MKHRIIPSLVPLAVDIAGLTPDPANARLHNERNIREVMASYEEHGQRKPIVLQKKGDQLIIRAGNGQTEAAKRLGWTHIAAVVVEEGDHAAKKFALRDNRTAELAEWDFEVLAREEALFSKEGDSLVNVGWDEAEVVPLRETTWFADAKGSLEDHQRSFGQTGTKEGISVITVRAEDEKDLQKAAALMREIAPQGQMHMGRVIGRLARHYLATITHSQAPDIAAEVDDGAYDDSKKKGTKK